MMFSVSRNYHISTTNMSLVHSVYDNNQQWLYDIPLLELYDHENGLTDGRFLNFSHESQEHSVIMENSLSTKKSISGEEFRYKLKQIIEWIAQHSSDTWSFFLTPQHVGNIDTIFSFKSVETAVLFKLVWWI